MALSYTADALTLSHINDTNANSSKWDINTNENSSHCDINTKEKSSKCDINTNEKIVLSVTWTPMKKVPSGTSTPTIAEVIVAASALPMLFTTELRKLKQTKYWLNCSVSSILADGVLFYSINKSRIQETNTYSFILQPLCMQGKGRSKEYKSLSLKWTLHKTT